MTRKSVGFVVLAMMLLAGGAVQAQNLDNFDRADPTGSAPSTRSIEGGIDCAGGEIHDSGNPPQNALGFNSAVITKGAYVESFVEGAGQELTTVCVCVTSRDGGSWVLDLVVFDNDGAGGGPGTELFRQSETIPNTPVWPNTNFAGITLDSTLIADSNIYVGLEWDATANPTKFICVDEDAGTPLWNGWVGQNLDGFWYETDNVWDNYRALYVRALFTPVVPAIDPRGLALLLVILAAAGSLLISRRRRKA
jgi:hypothetical protein